MYAIQPNHFPSVTMNSDIDIQAVTEDNLKIFLDLQYLSDVQYGEEFAKQKTDLLKRQFSEPNIHQVLALYKGKPAGSVELIAAEETVEIDNLFVDVSFRNKGIGSRLQKYAMEVFPNKTVILVADGEDTPKDMYRKQNYEYCGFSYEAVKVY
ncbi:MULTISPECIES: GNAT family N-acetyltransferase [unclassified Sporosarcina]|uniref:GNAT family N-acetyltransferase n=1 Tax=unclassified Sporosarcina TaxID=2647733 RepID=UPI00203FBD2E|nr:MULTISPECIES: GNAT family N-acetyltransferase [unclassified Sporosarcina]GKV67148.1 hypothetical protein NCCP2331_33010 [Sporosarcina sp. NCCP-2331]GLB57478.1 hypothetical protein NCCP2378_32660 [Sporosarcina sp. NCCP-2378]